MMKKDVAIIPDIEAEYDYVQQKLRTVPLQSKTVHLRPKRSREAQIERGRARAKMVQYSMLKTLIMSLLQLEPYLLMSFIRERKTL
jgi:hypothetical protein